MLTFFSNKTGLTLGLLVAFAASAMAQEIPWKTDLETANYEAAKQNKLVWLHFSAEWCRPCAALETFVFSSPLVQAVVDKSVVPVKVDVDLQTDLVSEYGISSVPADVVVTPAGRVVTKRNSPSTVNDYTKMFKGLSKTLAGLDSRNSGMAKDLAELKERLQPKILAGQNDFAPAAPSHSGPRITTEGTMLAKNNNQFRQNPFYQPASSESPVASTSKNSVVIKNEFESAGSRPSSQQPLGSTSQLAQAAIKLPDLTYQRKSSAFGQPSSNQRPMPTGAALAKIQHNKSIPNQFFEPENAASSQVNAIAKGTPQQAQHQFEPARSVQQASASRTTSVETEPGQTDRSAFALHGKCPVTLMTESKWSDGDQKFGCVHRGRTYLFASEDHLRMFQADPDKYSPLLAGYDPVIYHEQGELVEGLEIHGVFMGKLANQRIVLFSSAENRAKFEDGPNTKAYIETVRQAMLSTKGVGGSTLR